MNSPARNLTCFHTDEVERQTALPIAAEAEKRGYRVRFSANILERCEIGLYCQHACFPRKAEFSVIMLHDLGQGHNRWPDIWRYEPWDHFDLGLLPGRAWANRWQSCSAAPYTRPRLGVFETGWPKADILFHSPLTAGKPLAVDLRQILSLRHPHTVLYAPSWENNEKQESFVRALKDLPVNLLLKQAPWSSAYPQVLKNIEEMNRRHRGLQENIHIIDPTVGIMHCIAVADLVVSEESSVLIEGVLLNIPGIAVTDWLVPDCHPPRQPSVPFDFVHKTTAAGLQQTVQQILADLPEQKVRLAAKRDEHFSLLGSSAQASMDIIDACAAGAQPPIAPLMPRYPLRPEPPLHRWRRTAKAYMLYFKTTIRGY